MPRAGNSPYVQDNIKSGGAFGADAGVIAGGIIVANLIGFPEVEAAEVGGFIFLSAFEGAHLVAFGGLLGAGLGAVGGGVIGYNVTQPTCQ
jgi:hypothetical protein